MDVSRVAEDRQSDAARQLPPGPPDPAPMLTATQATDPSPAPGRVSRLVTWVNQSLVARFSVRTRTAFLIYIAAQIFFLIHIDFPRTLNFDEAHYIPAAREIISLHKLTNSEHPPLAKIIIATGIMIFGDNPLGWRMMSTIFGALTLVGMYMWAHAIFRSEKYARWVAALTLVNQLLYVQARIAMLDTFMFAFLVWALAYFTEAWNSNLDARAVRRKLLISGVLFGMATACKWFSLVPWFACGGLAIILVLRRSWPALTAWRRGETTVQADALWQGVRFRDVVLYLGLVPLVPYFVSFVPYFFLKEKRLEFTQLLSLQASMWVAQTSIAQSHPYMSHWDDWALLRRPIWYVFEKQPGNFIRGVVLLGNPAIMWSGLVAFVLCLWSLMRFRTREAFLVLFFYTAFVASWIAIPRKVSFYYYYYPAGMTLSLVLAYVFFHWEKIKGDKGQQVTLARWAYLAIAAGFFFYFFPIIGGLDVYAGDFRKWIWFKSWT